MYLPIKNTTYICCPLHFFFQKTTLCDDKNESYNGKSCTKSILIPDPEQ